MLRLVNGENLIEALLLGFGPAASNRHRIVHQYKRLRSPPCLQGQVKLDLTRFRCLMSFSVSLRDGRACLADDVFILAKVLDKLALVVFLERCG